MRDHNLDDSDGVRDDFVIQIIEQDRLRLSCDLHDYLLQPIVGALYQLQAYSNSLHQKSPREKSSGSNNQLAADHDEIATVTEHLRRSLTIGQQLIDELRCGFGRDESANNSVSEVVDSVVATRQLLTATTKIVTINQITVPFFLTSSRSAILAGFVTEAIQNAQQHASAQQITVSLTQPDETTVIVNIEDDGIGFAYDPKTVSQGLQGLRIRAELLRGELDLRSENSGTQVRLKLTTPASPSPPDSPRRAGTGRSKS